MQSTKKPVLIREYSFPSDYVGTRKVEIAAIAQVASGLWMSQIARNLTDVGAGILTGKRYLIHDRDPLLTAEFLNMISDSGVKSVNLPPTRTRGDLSVPSRSPAWIS
jgi:hypothetical protein